MIKGMWVVTDPPEPPIDLSAIREQLITQVIDGKQAAKILGCSPEYLRVRVSRGEIPSWAMQEVGSLRLYFKKMIEALAVQEKAERAAKKKARAAEARKKAARAKKRAERRAK